MNYKIEKGVICRDRGIPELPRWFSDGRLSFQFDGNAISQVDYRNPQQVKGTHTIFLQRLWDGFRCFLERQQVTYKPEFNQTRVYPFGIDAQWTFADSVLQHRLYAVGETIVFQLETPGELPSGCRFKLEFYEDYGLIPDDLQDFRYGDRNVGRKWNKWRFDEEINGLCGSLEDVPRNDGYVIHGVNINNPGLERINDSRTNQLHMIISADFPLQFLTREINTKYILTSCQELEPNRVYTFVIAMAGSEQLVREKMRDVCGNASSVCERQRQRYEAIAAENPVLISSYPQLNDFIRLAPLYHESCKVPERPGAIKAKNANFWVWGWDGMTSNYASLYWGDHVFIRDMLRFYEETADPVYGIGHNFGNDLIPDSVSALPAQSMYMTLLHQYYVFTKDKEELRRRFGFVRQLFAKILKAEAAGKGLCKGASLFPDFPSFMHESGDDISSLNNTILYCAARSMEAVASLLGETDAADEARRVFRGIEEHYLQLFYDEGRGFVVSSIDGTTLERRNSYNANAIKWENFYCGELMDGVAEQALQFFEEHIVCKAGLREIPVWSDAYDKDANQLHCWWPVTGEYYMQLINGGNRRERIEQWIGWVSYWTDKLICPEGISCYIDTDEPELDRWNTSSGVWHAYSMRGWYQAAIHGVVGVGIEAGGITFYPYDGEEMTLQGLHYDGQRFDIEMKGSGSYIEEIVADGVRIEASHKLPVAVGERQGTRRRVTVQRTKERLHPIYIERGYGIELKDYRYQDGVIEATVQGAGTCRLKLSAVRRPVVLVEGEEVAVRYNEHRGSAVVEFSFVDGQAMHLRIS